MSRFTAGESALSFLQRRSAQSRNAHQLKQHPVALEWTQNGQGARMAMSELNSMLKGYSLTTAEILYRLPDYKTLLQSYIWQDYDLHPKFPKLKNFLDFWEANLDGPLYKVTVNHRSLIAPTDLKILAAQFAIH